ncbi:S49 family peptidase, partial [bacterium]|nr:S49 family peptidase [bacterium]
MARESFFHDLWRSVSLTLLSLVVALLIVAGVVYLLCGGGPDIDDGSWLVLDLYGEITEYDPPGGPVNQVLGGAPLTLQDMIDNLGKAALDDRIAGVILKLSSTHDADLAKLQELRRAVDRVQAAGKPVHAWGDALDLKTLYLAAGCDDVAMPAGGYFEFRGLTARSCHVRAMLDKLGVTPHLHKIKDYKTAAEMVMNTEMSDAAREMRTWLLDDIWNVVVPAIAEERGLTEQRVTELMEYAEFEPAEAAESGLIDRVVYWQELEDGLRDPDDDILPVVTHAEYADVSWDDVTDEGDQTVAVIHAQGNIGGRENGIDPLWGMMMGHETIGRELRRCRLDDEVKAVVLRIDSGGGESLASDLIAHEVGLLAAVKPVVVSMVDVAASGGYYIAYKATRLMADPSTYTGSIGSINGFFNMRGFYDKLGVTKDFVEKGPMAGLGSDYRDPTGAEWERHADAHWKSFNTWLEDVARHRGLTFERAEALAHGRVWTGRQALENGLIDAVGCFDDALALAVGLAGLPAGERPRVVHLPETRSLLESILGDDPGVDSPVAAAARAALYREVSREVRGSLDFLER